MSGKWLRRLCRFREDRAPSVGIMDMPSWLKPLNAWHRDAPERMEFGSPIEVFVNKQALLSHGGLSLQSCLLVTCVLARCCCRCSAAWRSSRSVTVGERARPGGQDPVTSRLFRATPRLQLRPLAIQRRERQEGGRKGKRERSREDGTMLLAARRRMGTEGHWRQTEDRVRTEDKLQHRTACETRRKER